MAITPAKELVARAGQSIETLAVDEAQAMHGRDDVVFVDVREPGERARGTIPGAIHAPRGLIEFMADPALESHKPELASGKTLVVFCASGGRSALAAATLKEMGIDKVNSMSGGFNAWQGQGLPVETENTES